MKRKIIFIISFLSVIGYVIFRITKKGLNHRKIFENCHKLKIGMSIYDAYKALDTEIKPDLRIYLENDSSYHHYIIYPGRDESTSFRIEYDHSTKKIVQILDSQCSQ